MLHLCVREPQTEADLLPVRANPLGDAEQVGLGQQAGLRVAQVQRGTLALVQDEVILPVQRLWEKSMRKLVSSFFFLVGREALSLFKQATETRK